MIVKWRGIAWAPTRAETALWEAQAKGALSTINGCWPSVPSTQRAFSVNLTTPVQFPAVADPSTNESQSPH